MLVVGCIPNFSSERLGGVPVLARFDFWLAFIFRLSFFPFACVFFSLQQPLLSPPDLKTQHEEHSHFYKRLRCTVQYLIKAVGSP